MQKLYTQYGSGIYLYLYSLCQDHELAEDLMQETFVKALLSLPDSHANARAWLYLVARNIYFNERKKHQHQSLQDNETIQSIMDQKVSVYEDNIVDELLMKDQQRYLYLVLNKISKRQKEVLVLQFFGGFTLKEIASILQISPENARILSHRGRLELRKYMKEDGYDDVW